MPATLVKRFTRHAWPHLTLCPDCGQMVLNARGVNDRPFVLDPVEALPAARCEWCAHGRATRGTRQCPACGGTGTHGERITRSHHVLIDAHGHARRYDGTRRPWEAAHRRHRCP